MGRLTNTLSVLIILGRIAFFTLLERKILGYAQLRKGPNKVRLAGVLQPAGDGVKLFSKETTKLNNSNSARFIISPIIALTLAIIFWRLNPTIRQIYWTHFPITLFLCISTFAVYPIIIAGWASNSKYSLIGALRRVAQTISYEVRIALIIITRLIIIKSLKLSTLSSASKLLNTWIIIPILILIWFRTTLAETNRSPYDLAEGERELVSGFNTEYGGPEFAIIFMAEYINILFIAMLTSLIFFPTLLWWSISLRIKTAIFARLFIFVRVSFPRLRYDRLISITWRSYLPVRLRLIISLRWILEVSLIRTIDLHSLSTTHHKY